MNKQFQVLVVGAGHAGVEAAAAAARLGLRVGLISLDLKAIGRMSCNPAIGGIGKGQLAREIDALGGLMGLATDRAGIQFRTLNTSKGRAVHSPRAQCHRDGYEQAIQDLLKQQSNLELIAGEVVDLIISTDEAKNASVTGVCFANGDSLTADAVILTTGTFLEGVLHTGCVQQAGGRSGEDSAQQLGQVLRDLKLPTGRLKTGTPPRIAADSVDYSQMEEQHGDSNPCGFSFIGDGPSSRQISCWSTRTTPTTQEIVRANLDKAPMYAGRIEGRGPRYCPSLEDKVVRFSDRDSHQVFLEPESHQAELLYANGISTSLPLEIQQRFVRSIIGMENAQIIQAGYAVEYTYIAPSSLHRTLELRDINNLYLAGQICGTSGYEEAAAQGIMAGYNAALKIKGLDELILGRHQAYIGVLIDDLVVCDPTEPYRMFTSRAEHRLLLRHDTADRRLTPLAGAIGGICGLRARTFASKQAQMKKVRGLLESERQDLLQVLRRHDGGLSALLKEEPTALGWFDDFEDWKTLEADIKYAGYEERQQRWVDRASSREHAEIPSDFDYNLINGLRNEARECLKEKRPASLGVASRLAGVSPADLALVEVSLGRILNVDRG